MNVAKTNATNYPLGYYYVSTDHASKIDKFKMTSGDMETVLITQYVRGWLGKNRNFCTDLAKCDASIREMKFGDWASIVFEEGFRGLPVQKKEFNPPGLPLASVNLAAKEELVRRKVNNLTLGIQNIVFFKLIEHYYYRGKTIDLVSDIVAEHLNRLWEPLYASQVAADDFSNWV